VAPGGNYGLDGLGEVDRVSVGILDVGTREVSTAPNSAL
jgi:hypothetical protein